MPRQREKAGGAESSLHIALERLARLTTSVLLGLEFVLLLIRGRLQQQEPDEECGGSGVHQV